MSHKFKVKGLTADQVVRSRDQHGSNELPTPEVESFTEKLLDNFKDPLIKILLVALGITLALAAMGAADWVEGLGIAVAVFLATFVSTYSEYKNEASFQELQLSASKVMVNVFRGSGIKKVMIGDIVVGDLILLQAGDKVRIRSSFRRVAPWLSFAMTSYSHHVIRRLACPYFSCHLI